MRAPQTLPILCVLGFVIALTVTLLMARACLGLYQDLNRLRLDPVGLSRFRNPEVRPEGTVVVIFGDSRAAHWTAPESTGGVSFINRGISGQTTAQALARYEAHVASVRPDVLVVQMGGNDLKTVTLFPEREDEIVATCIENIRLVVAKAANSGTTVVLTTVFPHGHIPWYRRPVFDGRVQTATRRVNAALRAMAAPNIVVMDCDKILAGPDGLIQREYRRDLLHLRAEGYRMLNLHLLSVLESRLNHTNAAGASDAPAQTAIP